MRRRRMRPPTLRLLWCLAPLPRRATAGMKREMGGMTGGIGEWVTTDVPGETRDDPRDGVRVAVDGVARAGSGCGERDGARRGRAANEAAGCPRPNRMTERASRRTKRLQRAGQRPTRQSRERDCRRSAASRLNSVGRRKPRLRKGRGVAAARPALPTESATADDGGGGRPARDGRARGGGRPAGGDRARGRGRPRFAAGDDGGGERPPETEEETGWLKVVAPKDEAGREFAVGDDGGGGRSWTSGCT